MPNGAEKPVAFVFGPENGAVSEKLVYEAAREAHAKSYSHLYVIGFAIQPNARMLIDKSAEVVGIPATYVQATPDLMMGDLLKNMRSSQIFSVCGLPEIEVRKVKSKKGAAKQYEVELLGLDVFDPVEMVNHKKQGRRRSCVVSGHGLQRPLLPCEPSLLSPHRRMGKPKECAPRGVRRKCVGPSGRHGQRTVRAG